MPRRRGRPPEAPARARSPLDAAIEAAWLLAVGLIPIVFNGRDWLVFAEQPKQLVLHLTGLFIAAAWAFDSLFLSRRPPETARLAPHARLRAWAGRAPGRWAVIVTGALAVVAVLSTLLSPAPAVSVWGRDFGNLGYDLYSQLTLLVIFFAVALRLREKDQARRLAYVVAAAGSLTAAYGLSQHFGWDPFGPGAGEARVYSSQLNPVFFGSFLTMTGAVTLALALSERRPGRAWWLPFGAALLGLQFAALWFTGSRGPWLGSVVGIAAFLAMAAIWLDRRTLARAAALIAIAVVVAAVVAWIPADAGAGRGFGDLRTAFVEVADVVEDAVTPDPAPAVTSGLVEGIVPAVGGARASGVGAGPAGGEAGDVFDGSSVGPADAAVVTAVSGGGLSGRVDIWRGAFELATTWDREPADSAPARLLRPALGFGPEMYHYSYPLTAGPQRKYVLITHAHNYLVHTLLELGALGLLSFVTLAVLALLAGLGALRGYRGGRSEDAWLAIVMAGLIAALAGRAVEQMSGVARIGDLAPFWALMGLVVALGEIGREREPAAPEPRRRSSRGGRPRPASWTEWAPAGVAVTIVALAIAVFVAKDVQQLRASRLGAQAHAEIEAGNGTAAFDLLRRAGGLAPDVELYPVQAHALLRSSVKAETDATRKREQLEAGYNLLSSYARRDPLSFTVRERLAAAAVDLFEFGERERSDEVADRYRDLAAALPSYPIIQALAANGLLIGGDLELALEVAERGIGMERVTGHLPRAWWARGVALSGSGRAEGARRSFELAIARDPSGEWGARSHLALAEILELEGDHARAEAHRELGWEMLPGLRPAGS